MELFIIHEDGSLAEQCEMQLIAKDGLYMLRIPRKVQHVVLPASGRRALALAVCAELSPPARLLTPGSLLSLCACA